MQTAPDFSELIARLETVTLWRGWPFVGAALDGALWFLGVATLAVVTMTGEWASRGGATIAAFALLGAVCAPLIRFWLIPRCIAALKDRMQKGGDHG